MSLPIQLKHWHKSLFIGVNGQGKSVLFRALVRDYLEAGCRVFFYDSEHELTEKIPKKLKIEPEIYLAYLKEKYPLLHVYTPKYRERQPRVDEFDRVVGTLFKQGRWVLAVESIEFYVPTKKDLTENVEQLLNWGRNEDMGVLATLRRPQRAHADVGSLNNNVFLFHIYSYNDLKWCRAFLPKHIVDELPDLPRRHFIHYTQDGVTRHTPIDEEEAKL